MISIRDNKDSNFTSIRAIAKEVWPIAYSAILSEEQLNYMMEMMYSIPSLRLQQEQGSRFILAVEDETPVGFAAYELDYEGRPKTKIHKIYILSSQQGKGTGRILIDYITAEALVNNQEALLLNVNKNNVALHFYQKLGFAIADDVVIDIGNGYVMDDFIMEKPI